MERMAHEHALQAEIRAQIEQELRHVQEAHAGGAPAPR
jgi:hypothetical protein